MCTIVWSVSEFFAVIRWLILPFMCWHWFCALVSWETWFKAHASGRSKWIMRCSRLRCLWSRMQKDFVLHACILNVMCVHLLPFHFNPLHLLRIWSTHTKIKKFPCCMCPLPAGFLTCSMWCGAKVQRFRGCQTCQAPLACGKSCKSEGCDTFQRKVVIGTTFVFHWGGCLGHRSDRGLAGWHKRVKRSRSE